MELNSSLLLALKNFFLRLGCDKTYWIAFSGGLDSQVLLELCSNLRQELSLKLNAIHVDHRLSEHSQAWALHCRAICVKCKIPYYEQTLQIKLNNGDSLEELAREQRYAAFKQYLQPNDVLLTAHHQDDQAETVLLQLFRGAGVRGLAAMPEVKSFGYAYHARPLLGFSRIQLHKFAVTQQLNWLEDESNNNLNLTRNFLRHEIIPSLTKRWPTVNRAIARSANHCAEAQQLLDELTESLVVNAHGSQAGTLSVKKLLQLNLATQKLILRYWIQNEEHPLPDTKKLLSICQNVLSAAQDRNPSVTWQNTVIRRYRDDLYIMPPFPQEVSEVQYDWDLQKPLEIPGIGCLIPEEVLGSGIRADIGKVQVGLRKQGKWMFCKGRGKRSLKHLFQEWNVPPWMRERLPLLFLENKLISVVGFGIDADWLAGENEIGISVRLDSIIKKTNPH